MLSPTAVATLARQFQDTGGPLQVLEEFGAAIDGTDLQLLISILILVVLVSFSFIALLLCMLVPTTLPFVFWGGVGSFCLALPLGIYLAEPRPSHWFPSLESVLYHPSRTWSDCKMRVQRWYRWRKRYESRSKLNV